jgi:hypothetical protein
MRDEFFLSKETRSLATATDIFLESLKPDGLIRNYLHGGVGKTQYPVLLERKVPA